MKEDKSWQSKEITILFGATTVGLTLAITVFAILACAVSAKILGPEVTEDMQNVDSLLGNLDKYLAIAALGIVVGVGILLLLLAAFHKVLGKDDDPCEEDTQEVDEVWGSPGKKDEEPWEEKKKLIVKLVNLIYLLIALCLVVGYGVKLYHELPAAFNWPDSEFVDTSKEAEGVWSRATKEPDTGVDTDSERQIVVNLPKKKYTPNKRPTQIWANY